MCYLPYTLFLFQEKLKEKRPALTESLTQTLQAMHKSGCLNPADIVEGRFCFHYNLGHPMSMYGDMFHDL